MNIIKKCRHGMMIFPRQDIWQGRSFEIYGEYSESEVAIFRAIIKPGWTVFDIGANIGSLTLPFSRIVGPAGLVVAFEPERHAFTTLCGNISINNLRNVYMFQQALGSEAGSICVPDIDYENTQNVGALELWRDYSKVSHYQVSKTRIDDVKTKAVNFIKIDVEGMEEDVLRGGRETIAAAQPILYVESDRVERVASLLDFIESIGYQHLLHKAPFWNPQNYFEIPDNAFGDVVSINLLCWPASSPCPVDPKAFGLEPTPEPLRETQTPNPPVLAV